MLGEIYRVSMIGHRVVEDYSVEERLHELFWELLRTKEYTNLYELPFFQEVKNKSLVT